MSPAVSLSLLVQRFNLFKLLMNIHVRLADPDDKQAWDAYVLAHPDGMAYHLFAWKEAVEKAYAFECPYFIATSAGQVCGVLPTALVQLPFRSGSLVSLPYCDVGGILADSAEIAEALLAHVLDFARKCSIPCLELRSSVLRGLDNWNTGVLGGEEGDDWIRHNNQSTNISNPPINQSTNISSISSKPIPQSTNPPPTKVRMLLPLPESSETLLSSFKSKLRSQVRKPAKDGLTAKLGGEDLLEPFYRVFAENMRDLGSPVHSKEWIRSILHFFDSRARCGVVFMPDGRPAAAGIILCHDRVVSIPWASSLRRFNRSNPNMLLYWSFLEHAADNGYASFDFGRSTPGEGTYRFKEQRGASPHPLHWVRVEAQNGKVQPIGLQDGEQAAPSRSRQAAEKVFQSLPVPMATSVGSRIRKYISL